MDTTSMIAVAFTANVMYIAPRTPAQRMGSVGPSPHERRIVNATSARVIPTRNCATL